MIRRFRAWRRRRLERKLAQIERIKAAFDAAPFDPEPQKSNVYTNSRIQDYSRRLESRVGRLRLRLAALADEGLETDLKALPEAKIVPLKGRKL